ncbi:Kinase [Hexamita inflata]|uniref:non-specific serine/threonine protein kinase n=1 Tax=Hexamita inflata TaxID=28002 RepID=A0AA86Q859_9EUKA|nr:CAMK CAMKL [Hexamita inflata]
MKFPHKLAELPTLCDIKFSHYIYYIDKYKVIKQIYDTPDTKYYLLHRNGHNFAGYFTLDQKSAQNRIKMHALCNDIHNIVKVLYHQSDVRIQSSYPEIGLNGTYTFILYEYCPYSSISRKTFADTQQLTPYQIGKILNIFHKILLIINQMHQRNIYHLDLKPENILCNGRKIQIIDLGSAQIGQENVNFEPLSTKQDTLCYISEKTSLFSAVKHDSFIVIGQKYDTYSLGCTLYNILTDNYLMRGLVYKSETYDSLVSQFGLLITDLILGMTNQDKHLRLSLNEVLDHPVFKIVLQVSLFKKKARRQFISGMIHQIKEFIKSTEHVNFIKEKFQQIRQSTEIAMVTEFHIDRRAKINHKLGLVRSQSIQNLIMKPNKLIDDQCLFMNLNKIDFSRNVQIDPEIMCSFADFLEELNMYSNQKEAISQMYSVIRRSKHYGCVQIQKVKTISFLHFFDHSQEYSDSDSESSQSLSHSPSMTFQLGQSELSSFEDVFQIQTGEVNFE